MSLYDTVASQLTNALTSIEAQLRDMESKGLMRSPDMTAQEAFKLVASCDDLEKALDGAMYVQVGTSSRFLSFNLHALTISVLSNLCFLALGLYFFKGFSGVLSGC